VKKSGTSVCTWVYDWTYQDKGKTDRFVEELQGWSLDSENTIGVAFDNQMWLLCSWLPTSLLGDASSSVGGPVKGEGTNGENWAQLPDSTSTGRLVLPLCIS